MVRKEKPRKSNYMVLTCLKPKSGPFVDALFGWREMSSPVIGEGVIKKEKRTPLALKKVSEKEIQCLRDKGISVRTLLSPEDAWKRGELKMRAYRRACSNCGAVDKSGRRICIECGRDKSLDFSEETNKE